jgi:hypothetical protein
MAKAIVDWRRMNMPLLLLWAIPAIVVVGGGTYMMFMR